MPGENDQLLHSSKFGVWIRSWLLCLGWTGVLWQTEWAPAIHRIMEGLLQSIVVAEKVKDCHRTSSF